MKAELGLTVLYRNSRGEDRAGVVVGVFESGQAEIWLFPRMGEGGILATPVAYSEEPKESTWRPAFTKGMGAS